MLTLMNLSQGKVLSDSFALKVEADKAIPNSKLRLIPLNSYLLERTDMKIINYNKTKISVTINEVKYGTEK